MAKQPEKPKGTAGIDLSTDRQNPAVGPDNVIAVVLTIIFLYVLAVNMMVLSFDIPRATSLT